jgi:hypothetical protein
MTVFPADVASATATFTVWADHTPDVICRVGGLFAQHNFVPDLFKARTLGDQLHITIRLSPIEEVRAQIIAAKINALVSVQQCRLEVTVSRRALWAA